MSQARIASFRHARATARARGDAKMVRAMDLELSRLGDGLETTQAAPELEYAVPEAAKRGRKPLPRCEHNLVADRCHLCNPENAV